jgi:hypothetical protein
VRNNPEIKQYNPSESPSVRMGFSAFSGIPLQIRLQPQPEQAKRFSHREKKIGGALIMCGHLIGFIKDWGKFLS